METYSYYKGYGIRYESFTGTTSIEDCGIAVKIFPGKGEIDGNLLAKKFIDKLVCWR